MGTSQQTPPQSPSVPLAFVPKPSNSFQGVCAAGGSWAQTMPGSGGQKNAVISAVRVGFKSPECFQFLLSGKAALRKVRAEPKSSPAGTVCPLG